MICNHVGSAAGQRSDSAPYGARALLGFPGRIYKPDGCGLQEIRGLKVVDMVGGFASCLRLKHLSDDGRESVLIPGRFKDVQSSMGNLLEATGLQGLILVEVVEGQKHK